VRPMWKMVFNAMQQGCLLIGFVQDEVFHGKVST